MEIVQIIGVAFIATFIVVLLKQYRPEYATFVSIIAGVLILSIVVFKLSGVIELLNNLATKLGVNTKFFIIILKITGIAYLTEFASSICKDSGETAIASKVEIAAKILIIAMSIPILGALIETIVNIMP